MTAAHISVTESGQQVSEVPGQPGRVITGRPKPVELRNPNLLDPFAAFDEDEADDEECLDCPDGMRCVCKSDCSDADWDRERD